MNRFGYKFNKNTKVNIPKEAYNATFQFRPYKIYRILSKDEKYNITCTASDNNTGVFIKENDGVYDEDYTANNELFYVDSDTGCISFFNTNLPYFTFMIETGKDVSVKRSDNIGPEALFRFMSDGSICCLNRQEYYLCANSTGARRLMVAHKENLKNYDIKYWTFKLMYDSRDLLEEHLTTKKYEELAQLNNDSIEVLRAKNIADLKKADAEITYRDNIIIGYENNWFFKALVNSGKTPSNMLISQRSFARNPQ